MFIRHLICFLICLSPSVAWAQFIQTDSAIRCRIVKDVCVLASDSLQGRKSGTVGEQKASGYIISEFSKIGLQPKGTDSGSYLQTFPIVVPDFGVNRWQSNQMVINGKRFTYIRDFGPVAFSANGKFTGSIKVLSPGTDLSAIVKSVEKDKTEGINSIFFLLDLNNPGDTLPAGQPFSHVRAKELALSMFAIGAAGILFWDRHGKYYNDLFDFRKEDSVPGPVVFLSSEAGKEISSSKKMNTIDVSILKPVYRSKKCNNVIGFFDNHAPYTIIIGAHYDHMGINRKSEIRYGADDNASGTATMMELARYLKNSGERKNNYLFIAFSGEEDWLVGSNYFCEHPTLDLKTVNYMFNFDMVGRLGCEGNKITAIGTYSSPEWKRVFSSIPKQYFRIKKMKGTASFSDHYGFYRKGIPVAYLTTGLHYDYHTPRDVAAKINYEGMVQVVKYAEDFIRRSEDIGRISFRKVPGWYQFTSTTHYILKELDYMLTVGMDE